MSFENSRAREGRLALNFGVRSRAGQWLLFNFVDHLNRLAALFLILSLALEKGSGRQ